MSRWGGAGLRMQWLWAFTREPEATVGGTEAVGPGDQQPRALSLRLARA